MQPDAVKSLSSLPQHTSAVGNPPGEAAMAAVGRIGAQKAGSRLVSKSLAEIDLASIPCVLLLKNGNGLAVVDILDGDTLSIAGGNGTYTVKRSDLSDDYTGSAIVAAPAAAPPNQTETVSPATTARPGADGPDLRLSAIFRQIMKSGQVIELFLIAILSNLFMFALPLFSMAVYDRIIPHRAYETLWALTTGLLIVLVMDFTGRILRMRVQESISQKISAQAQRDLFNRIISTDIDHAPKSASGISGALTAIETAAQLAPSLLVGLSVDLPFIVLLFIYIGSVAKWLVVVPLVSIAIITVASLVLHATAKRAHASASKQNVKQTMLIEESIGSFAVAKVTTAQQTIFATWSRALTGLSSSAATARSAANLSNQIASAVIQINTVFALVIGVFLISSGDMTVGALVSAVMLSGRALSPLISLVTGIVRMASLAEPLNLARTLAAVPAEIAGDPDRTKTRLLGEIHFQSVEMRYLEAPTLSLRGIDLVIKPGEKVAIIGRIGSGKSTLAKLLPRLHVPTAGSVLIDGQDVRQYDPDFLRRQIAYMPQDCDLFDASIRENIIKGLTQVDELGFEEAVRISGVKDIIANHPSGYDLGVGRGGRRLSGGERQAVCLARALVRRSPLMVLDEPTSAMDSQMEQAVVERLRHHLGNKTVIIATHRTPLLALVDRVIWLNGGKIIADGPPQDVIARASRAA